MSARTTKINHYQLHPNLRFAIGAIMIIYVLILASSFFVDISNRLMHVLSLVAMFSVWPEIATRLKIWVKSESL